MCVCVCVCVCVCGGVHALYSTLCPAVLLHIPFPAVYHSTQHHTARMLESSLYVLSHSPYGIILICRTLDLLQN